MSSEAPDLLIEFRDVEQAAAVAAVVRHAEAMLAAIEDNSQAGLHTAKWQLRAALAAVKRGV